MRAVIEIHDNPHVVMRYLSKSHLEELKDRRLQGVLTRVFFDSHYFNNSKGEKIFPCVFLNGDTIAFHFVQDGYKKLKNDWIV